MRIAALRLFFMFLLVALSGCSKKPADTASSAPSQNVAAPSSDASGQNATAPNDAAGNAMNSPAASAAPAPVPPPPPPPITIPVGTALTVKLGGALGSKLSAAGDPFRATLASAIAVDGTATIPAGASVRGVVVDAEPLGKLKGGASLVIKLTSISVNGVDQSIATSSISRTKKGKGKRTAAMAGGGTAFGAVVGGLAGGGKGAAIGALAGGGAGTAGAAYTGNDDIVLPAGSALSFKLKSPLTVTVGPAQ